ncbi:hypothetical protein L1887_09954 [Cichorium endivia]|nr:hypothetical protein L1887_09954 [Cichorium endivia]
MEDESDTLVPYEITNSPNRTVNSHASFHASFGSTFQPFIQSKGYLEKDHIEILVFHFSLSFTTSLSLFQTRFRVVLPSGRFQSSGCFQVSTFQTPTPTPDAGLLVTLRSSVVHSSHSQSPVVHSSTIAIPPLSPAVYINSGTNF